MKKNGKKTKMIAIELDVDEYVLLYKCYFYLLFDSVTEFFIYFNVV